MRPQVLHPISSAYVYNKNAYMASVLLLTNCSLLQKCITLLFTDPDVLYPK